VLLVVDADCFIAGTLAKRGAASDLLNLWQEGAFELVACPHLVEEIRKALLDARIAKRYAIGRDEVDELCRRIRDEALWLPDPAEPPNLVPADPGDDYLVQLGLNAKADALVTRDHHFEGVRVEGLDIVWPGPMLSRLRQIDN
jgi:predicted nucleic acid-binding protein